MLCYAMLCHAMPCHAMPCHAMPCHAMLHCTEIRGWHHTDAFGGKLTVVCPPPPRSASPFCDQSRAVRVRTVRHSGSRLSGNIRVAYTHVYIYLFASPDGFGFCGTPRTQINRSNNGVMPKIDRCHLRLSRGIVSIISCEEGLQKRRRKTSSVMDTGHSSER